MKQHFNLSNGITNKSKHKMKIETVIDRTNGGEGRISDVRVYIDGVLMQHTMIFPNKEQRVFNCQKETA